MLWFRRLCRPALAFLGLRQGKGAELVSRKRRAEEVALCEVASARTQYVRLRLSLHPLRRHLDPLIVGHLDDGAQQGFVVFIVLDVSDEGTVNLEVDYGEVLQSAERGPVSYTHLTLPTTPYV